MANKALGKRPRSLLRFLAAICLAGVACTTAYAQMIIEDLDIEEELVSPEIERVFESAQKLFASVDQADSLMLFTTIIEELQPMVITGDPRVLDLLRTSLLQRSEANLNFGETDAARSDLVTLVTTSPGFEVDPNEVSDQIREIFEKVREDLVGYVEFIIDPLDAKVTVEGAAIPTDTGPVPILAGSYAANIHRPGFTSSATSIDVAPSKATTVEVILERTSAVVALRTRPTAARIFVDGVERAETQGSAGAGFVATGDAAAFNRSEFSKLLWIDNLDPGTHQIEIRKAGYRSFKSKIELDGLVDVRLGAVLLEQEAGTLVLTALPSDAIVSLDGTVVRPFSGASQSTAELPLSPGSYLLSVTRGVFGRFEAAVDIADRKATRVTVKLQPALVMLGVLGKDEVGARKLSSGLADAFQAEGRWALLDRAVAARPILRSLGASVDKLRRLVNGADTGSIDWNQVQSTFGQEIPGSVFVLGVLSDDLLANEASLWIWPAAPGPSNPELRRIRLDEAQDLEQLATGFQPSLDPIRPTFGATLIDTPLASGPVIVELSPGKSAAQAGLAVGDAVTSIGGVPVFSEALFYTQLLAFEAGETVQVEFQRGGQAMTAELTTGRSYSVIDLSDPNRIAAPLAAALANELQSASSWPRWVLLLNQAAILLNAGDAEGAVRQLRQIDPSQSPKPNTSGLNMGTVNYWLGVALEQAGPRYLDRARDAYQEAAAATGARFFHDDGPRVAPRAWSRLQRLSPGGS